MSEPTPDEVARKFGGVPVPPWSNGEIGIDYGAELAKRDARIAELEAALTVTRDTLRDIRYRSQSHNTAKTWAYDALNKADQAALEGTDGGEG